MDEPGAWRGAKEGGEPAGQPAPDIAVIGLACRFPGAPDAQQFWENLRSGVESITVLTERDLAESGIGPATWRRPDYVKAAPVLDDVRKVRCSVLRLLTARGAPDGSAAPALPGVCLARGGECRVRSRALRRPHRSLRRSALNSYLLFNGDPQRLRDDYLYTLVANDKDFLTSRVSYQLNLTRPQHHRTDRMLNVAGRGPPRLPEPA